jgi:ParB-like chromosome segregation protein Spo0J
MSAHLVKIKGQQIRIDGGTQPRAALNEAIVAEYADAISAGVVMPPVVVFFDGSTYWLADGFHRFHAYRKAGKANIEAAVNAGTRRDAVLHSVGANNAHGLRRTNEDKRRAVSTLLADDEWSSWSDRQIAEACGVTHTFVAAVRNPVVAERQQSNRGKSQARRVESDSTHEVVTAPSPEAAKAHEQIEPRRIEVDRKPGPVTPAPKLKIAAGPTIESLTQENARLCTELAEARENAAELAYLLESYSSFEEGEQAAVREMAKLRGLLRTVETQRDTYMRTCSELRREVKGLRRRAGEVA